MKSQRSYIALQMSHGQRKYLFRNLLAIWTRALKKVCQPCRTVWSTRHHIIQASGTTQFDSTHVTLKDRKRSLSGKNDHNATWHYRSSYNAKLRVVAVLKQPQRVVAWEKQPQGEMSFKWTVYTFTSLLIRNTCNVGLLKNNTETRLFLQALLEWHFLELHFIFFERHLHFLSMQYFLQWQLTNPCVLPDVIIEANRRDSEL